MNTITQEKLDQAVALLAEQNLDCWITFVRETGQVMDPALDLLTGFGLTWVSALIIARDGSKTAIVGRYDADNVRKLEAWTEVIGYDTSIEEHLRKVLERLNPGSIGLNYSLSDPASDGLTFGMYAKLATLLAGTPFPGRFTSAENVARRLRERKSPAELSRIRHTIGLTEQLYAQLFALPLRGMTEIEVHAKAGEYASALGAEFGWERLTDPIVNAGPDSSIGHGIPSNLVIQPGQILHLDMGLRHDDYCSDLQRDAYVLREGETEAPEAVTRAWAACRAALEAARAAIKPGIIGADVDAIARKTLIDAGYPEFMHAFAHHVGRRVHDGGSILGPRWAKYSDLPNKPVELGAVYAIELGTMVEGIGYLGLEENVVVTATGAEYLSTPQTELILL